MSINNVRPVGDDRPWKDEVERELSKIWDTLRYGKITLRAASSSTASGGGGSTGPGLDAISAVAPATYDTVTYTIGVDQDSFDHLALVDYVEFDTSYATGSNDVGIVAWSQDFETLETKLNSNVTLQFGQEHLVRVKNASGSVAIPDMTVVMFAGATGDTVTVAPAVTDGSISEDYILGVTTQTIDADGFGFVTQFGFINGVDTSAYTLGDILYADPSTPGGFTTTQPAAPNLKLPLAAVTRVNGSSGRVLVRAFVGKKLSELHDVQIATITGGELLVWDDANDRWVNQTIAEAGIATSNNPTFTGTVTTPLTTAGYVTTTSGGVLGSVSTIPNAGLTNSAITINGSTVSLGGSATVTAVPSGSAGGDLTGTYPNPTIKADVELTNPKIGRDNSGEEGGQLNFARASDNATYWYMDSFGSTSTPAIRFIAGTDNRFQINANGSMQIGGSTGTSGQVLQSTGSSTPPQWATVSGTSSNSFTTINTPAGTDPTATSSTDTLNFADGTGIDITGDSGTKTVTIALNASLDELNDVTITSATTGQALAYNGSGWVNSSISSSPNYLINGGFDIWQRGTSFSNNYTADRWRCAPTGSGGVTRVSSDLPTAAGVQYAAAVQTLGTSDKMEFYQPLESSVVIPLRGKTVTFSCYVKMDSTMAGNIKMGAWYSNVDDAYASQTTEVSSTTLVKASYSSWTRATLTFTVPSDADGLKVGFDPLTLTPDATDTFYWVSGAQLELGSTATDFRRNGNNPEAELAACERYYIRFTQTDAGNMYVASGVYNTTTGLLFMLTLPTTMRTPPSGSYRLISDFDLEPFDVAPSTLAFANATERLVEMTATDGTARTRGFGALLAINASNGYVAFDAEL